MVTKNKLEKKKYWIWLSMIPNLSCMEKQKLLKIYKSPEEIYNLSENKLLQVKGISNVSVKNILNEKIKENLERHIEYMLKNNIDIISIVDEEYPKSLRNIYDFPVSLYCKGNIKILKDKVIAIVGCRDATNYGKNAAKYFSYNIAKQNINIVSGLARGIDSYAHIGVICAQIEENSANSINNLKKCGKTIAILGNGLDIIYPEENKKLAQQILENGGCIMSEYPLGAKPERIHFPERNRIISGISDGILVIEAKEKSGTLITVDFALEQGKDVYAVPGNINSNNSVGTNELIKQGAKMVTNYEEVISAD